MEETMFNRTVLGFAAAMHAAAALAQTPVETQAPAGAAIEAPITEPKLIEGSCTLKRPADSVEAKQAGTVRLRMLIMENGTIADMKILKSSQFRELDRTTMILFSRCRYVPAFSAGKPVRSWIVVSQEWEAEG